MVTSYSVPRLSSQTPDSARNKLTAALKGVTGVESVTLKPNTHQFEIKGQDKNEPKPAEITAASMNAGFKIEAQKKKK